ncbi:MAG: glycosyltransferase family 4 protein [Gammaproteobacteria bacterium]
MKVLIANKYFFLNGGSEVVMFQEREHLLRHDVQVIDFSMRDERNVESDYASYFVSNQAYNNVETAGFLEKIKSSISFVHSAEAVRNIESLIKKEKPDIVHCHNIYHQLSPSIIGLAARRGIPVILTLHDYKTICPVYTRLRNGMLCSECLDNRYINVIKNRCAGGSLGKSSLMFVEAFVQMLLGNYEKANMIIAPSQFMADSVIGHKFSKEKVKVLYNGIDVGAIRPVERDHDYILYMGRISAEKGVQTLLEAHSRMNAGVKLIIAGTGPLEGELKKQYPKIQFMGYVQGAEKEKLLSEAAIVVVPSNWYENCPISVLEAMAYGKPLVASDIGGIPEIVLDEETGLLFDATDVGLLRHCLEKLMGNKRLRQQFGAAGRARAEQYFSLDGHNNSLMGIYNAVAA